MQRITAKIAAIYLLVIVSLSGAHTLAEGEINLIPSPKHLKQGEGTLNLPADAKIAVRDPKLQPLAEVLAQQIFLRTGERFEVVEKEMEEAGIVLSTNPAFESEAYTIDIDRTTELVGKDYRAVAWSTATLIQLVEKHETGVALPRLSIKDAPDYKYRGVLIDLARRHHPLHTVKQAIAMLASYKINYVHLHLSDTQGCVYSSRVLPKMATEGAYSWEQMKDLVRFADDRGVTIIPEIDIPGHSSSWVGKMPEIFGTTDPKTGESKRLNIVNMANENAYEALDSLIGELSEVFASSPYIHIGTDETGAGGLIKLPEYQPYCKKHGLTEALDGKAHELYLHFIERMNEVVRKHGKQTIAWNDFRGASTPNVEIPTNLVAMCWTGSPEPMVAKGYPIINCCWVPLYMVPPQGRAPEAHRIYDWDVRTFMDWHWDEPIALPEATPVMGAQICFWEQRYNEVLPILRPRVPAFAERLWHESAGHSFEDLKRRRDHTDRVVQELVAPVTIHADGLIEERAVSFVDTLSVKLQSSAPGVIRYTLSKPWETFPGEDSAIYSGPVKLDDTMTVSARLYDSDGTPIGGVTQQRFRKITPAYRYRLLGPTPNAGWTEMPDFEDLKELRTGVMGLMDTDRSSQINRSMFARLNPNGHVDVRVHNVFNPLTIELKGQIKIPVSGKYQFKLRSNHGLSELHFSDSPVVQATVPGREIVVEGKLDSGTYPLTIKHFYKRTKNELNIWIKTPGASEFEPFENFVVPLSDWVSEEQLQRLPAGENFVDPTKAANRNLATNKRVVVSGGTQGAMRPENAVDGSTENGAAWHADPYPQWLQVDLGKVYSVGRVKLFTHYDGNRYYQYTIEVSGDGKSWKKIVNMADNVQPSSKDGDEHNFDPTSMRYVRVNMTNNSANSGVHINELMVFEAEGLKE